VRRPRGKVSRLHVLSHTIKGLQRMEKWMIAILINAIARMAIGEESRAWEQMKA
jgi:hypothetical protein